MKIGYARVSSVGQSLENQIESLTKAGCEKIFKEKASGKSAENREQLQVALDFVREGDVLIITKLDRLARSMIDLSQISKKLKEKHVGLKALDQPDIDTTSAIGELLFNVLGAVAAFERSLINERTAEGRIKAIAKGVKFGAKAKLTDSELNSMAADFHSNDYTKTDLAKKYNISRASLYRLVGNHEIEAVTSLKGLISKPLMPVSIEAMSLELNQRHKIADALAMPDVADIEFDALFVTIESRLTEY